MIWANLLHLGYNMWAEKGAPDTLEYINASDRLILCEKTWDGLIEYCAASGVNTVVIDLGEGVNYQSHPELSVRGGWSAVKLRAALDRIRALGMTPIPKMNFSAAHDEWLGVYSHMLSTPEYYKVCGDLICEACALFDNPEYFHLGMDEETFGHQRDYLYQVVRAPKLWWRDLYILFDAVEKNGSIPWVWSDAVWHRPEDYVKNMPKHVLQSNWYYGSLRPQPGSADETYIRAFDLLNEHGYTQVPTGSNWSDCANFGRVVGYCAEHVDKDKLLGFMQTAWKPTVPERKHRHMDALDQLAAAKKAHEGN